MDDVQSVDLKTERKIVVFCQNFMVHIVMELVMGQMFMILHYFQVVCQDLPKILEFHEKSHCLQLRFKHLFYLSSNPLSFYYHLAFYIKKNNYLLCLIVHPVAV